MYFEFYLLYSYSCGGLVVRGGKRHQNPTHTANKFNVVFKFPIKPAPAENGLCLLVLSESLCPAVARRAG